MLEKAGRIGQIQLARLAFVVKPDQASGPVHVTLGRLGPAEMVEGSLTDLVEEPR
jgi:hypothetical protein